MIFPLVNDHRIRACEEKIDDISLHNGTRNNNEKKINEGKLITLLLKN